MERNRIESGARVVETADYRGYGVRVVAGWYVVDDQYLVHLYITPPGGPEIKVYDPPRRDSYLDDVLAQAFADARTEIDFLTDGTSS